MEQIARIGAGVMIVVVPRDSEGRSLRARREQNTDVNQCSYDVGAQRLADQDVQAMAILTRPRHSPLIGLEAYGLRIMREVPFETDASDG